MSMKQCKNGHFFDPERNPAGCPYCGVEIPDLVQPTQPVGSVPQQQVGGSDADKTVPLGGGATAPPATGSMTQGVQNPGETRAVGVTHTGIRRVVGWLICIAGPEQGRDYHLHEEKNFVGRSPEMDICIEKDDGISRSAQVVVIYDGKANIFMLDPGPSRSLAYLNGEMLNVPTQLVAYDRIELGKSEFMFVPFCGESFQWV